MPVRSVFLAQTAISNEDYERRQQESAPLIASLATALAPLTRAWAENIDKGATAELPMITGRTLVTKLINDHADKSASQLVDYLCVILNEQHLGAKDASGVHPKAGNYAHQFATNLIGEIFALKRGEQVRHYPGINIPTVN